LTVARFIADQRTDHRVPHAVACRALDVNESWFYKWRDRRRRHDSSAAPPWMPR
jgi:transposase-like protein